MTGSYLDPSLKEVAFNPTYETMFSPEVRLHVKVANTVKLNLQSVYGSTFQFICTVVNDTALLIFNFESY